MRIAIIGTGSVGRALGKGWASAGHEVVYGSRDPGSDSTRSLLDEIGSGATAAIPGKAVARAEVVVLAVPWSAVEEVLGELGNLTGRILIDATNPLSDDLSGLDPGDDRSGGEAVAKWAAGARVVKAFNTTGANNMADARYPESRLAMFLCGDDSEAKATVAGLAEELGFDAVDAGPISCAAELEHLALLWIGLAYRQGMGREIGFALLRREEEA